MPFPALNGLSLLATTTITVFALVGLSVTILRPNNKHAAIFDLLHEFGYIGQERHPSFGFAMVPLCGVHEV